MTGRRRNGRGAGVLGGLAMLAMFAGVIALAIFGSPFGEPEPPPLGATLYAKKECGPAPSTSSAPEKGVDEQSAWQDCFDEAVSRWERLKEWQRRNAIKGGYAR